MTPVLFLLLLLLNLQPSNNDVAPKDLAPRIVGGKDCLVKKWPFIVKIVSDFICGGSIITPRHVLTAAHCIVDEVITLRQQRVIAGSSHPGQDESKYNMKKIQVSVVKKGERHKKYDNRDGLDLRYDIGILILEKAMRVTSSVRLAKLPKIGYVDKCKKIKAAGWGLTQVMAIDPSQRPKNMKASRKLQCIELPLYPLDKCMEKWPRHKMDESVICTMYEPGGEDTCKGDSGGPIVCGGFLVGTVSAGAGCATPGMPALYMRVDRHIRFITKHTGINYTVLVQRSHDEAAKRRQTSAASRNTVLTILHVVTSILLTILCQ